MPGSSTTPGRPGARVDVPVRVAFRLRNGVGAQDMNLYEAQWLAYALPYRRFAAALTDCDARLGADMDRYSFIVSDLHRLLVAGLPAHCERFWTLPCNRPFCDGHHIGQRLGSVCVFAENSPTGRGRIVMMGMS
jgi:hypothetical protein